MNWIVSVLLNSISVPLQNSLIYSMWINPCSYESYGMNHMAWFIPLTKSSNITVFINLIDATVKWLYRVVLHIKSFVWINQLLDPWTWKSNFYQSLCTIYTIHVSKQLLWMIVIYAWDRCTKILANVMKIFH